WVSSRAAGRRGQAAAMYLLAYYLGSSTFGALIGLAFQHGGWPTAAGAIAALFVLGGLTVTSIGPTTDSRRA
ncbi:MAG: putative arabinose efflux permease, family, partial [Marmoricola sp.]|nr:putative arabinose efflux permease, family [Marmoricola sp.]